MNQATVPNPSKPTKAHTNIPSRIAWLVVRSPGKPVNGISGGRKQGRANVLTMPSPGYTLLSTLWDEVLDKGKDKVGEPGLLRPEGD